MTPAGARQGRITGELPLSVSVMMNFIALASTPTLADFGGPAAHGTITTGNEWEAALSPPREQLKRSGAPPQSRLVHPNGGRYDAIRTICAVASCFAARDRKRAGKVDK